MNTGAEPAGTEGGSAGNGNPRLPAVGRRIGVLVGVAVLVLAADILTKALVVAHLRPGEPVHVLGDVLELNLLRNSGAAFSIGAGDTILFTAIAVIVVGYIVRTARKLRSTVWAVTFGLLLGGACGNLVDRIFRSPGLFRGDVVDFIEVTRYWPVFNLADSAIVCGGILTVLLALLGYHMDGTRGDRATGDADAARDPADPASDPADPASDVGGPPSGTAGAESAPPVPDISGMSFEPAESVEPAESREPPAVDADR
ncbi:MAG: signal peptidase II [Nocardiopsaceae bacterium]|nr:signal peptidase II [Nocardiopsaceae bacterium]